MKLDTDHKADGQQAMDRERIHNKIWTKVQKANDVDQCKKKAGVTATEVFSQALKVFFDANAGLSKTMEAAAATGAEVRNCRIHHTRVDFGQSCDELASIDIRFIARASVEILDRTAVASC